MTLWDINKEIEKAFLDCIDPETGEIIDDTSVLDQLQVAKDEKIENIALMIKNLNAEAAAIKAEKENLQKRQKATENRSEWLKKYLADYLQGESFKTAKTAITWRKSESVDIRSMDDVPEDYLKFKEPEADKAALKKALKAGQVFDGIALVTKNNIQIK